MSIINKVLNYIVAILFAYMFSYAAWIFAKPFVLTPLVFQNSIDLQLSFQNSEYDSFFLKYDNDGNKANSSFTFGQKGDTKALSIMVPYPKAKSVYFGFGKKGSIVKIDSLSVNGENISLTELYNSLDTQGFIVGKSKDSDSIYLKSKGDSLYKFEFTDKLNYISEEELEELSESEKLISYSLFAIIFIVSLSSFLLFKKVASSASTKNTVTFIYSLICISFLIQSFCLISGYKFIAGIEEENNITLNFIKYESNLLPLIIFILVPTVLSIRFKTISIKIPLCLLSLIGIVILGIDNFVSCTFGSRFIFQGATGFVVDIKTAIPFFFNYISTTNGFIAIMTVVLFVIFVIKFFTKELEKKIIVYGYAIICFFSLIFAFWKYPYSDFDIYFANVFQVNHFTTSDMGDYQRPFSDTYTNREKLDYKWTVQEGLNKQQNVIVILVESLTCDLTMICNNNSDKELMPNLVQIANNGLVFDNYYSDAFSTSMATLSVIKSFPTFPQRNTIDDEHGKNKYVQYLLKQNDLVDAFNKSGYKTSFFSSTDLVFFMDKNLELTNFDEIYDSDSGIFDKNDKKFVFNSVSDEVLFNSILKYIDTNKNENKLFMMTKTASSHVPFESPWGSQDFDNSFLYTDYALSKFIRELEKRNYFDDGIVVITGDHQPWGYVKSNENRGLFGKNQVPLIILDKNKERRLNHTMFSHASLGVYIQSLMLDSYRLNKFNADPIHSDKPALMLAYEFDKQIFAIVKQGEKESRIKFNGDDSEFMNDVFDNEYENDILGYLSSCSL